MKQEQQKQLAGEYAVRYLLDDDMVIGVGTGSTVKYFISALGAIKSRIQGVVSSSEASTRQLRELGIQILDLNATGNLDIYIDGADQVTPHLCLTKGGGAALTREKVIAAAAAKFICIADESKYHPLLGSYPVPLEVIPMARSYVAREVLKLGGSPVWRDGVITDNGNWILDVHNWQITNPVELEQKLNNIVGIVTNGIFAMRPADELVLAHSNGSIEIIRR